MSEANNPPLTLPTKRVIIVHGWADDPAKGWIAWLVSELRSRGVEAIAPAMPSPKKPDIDTWLHYLQQVIGLIDSQTVLVGHSLGAYVLLRYLDKCTDPHKLGKLILVGGFAGHERATQGKHVLPEVDFATIRAKVEQIYSVYSDDDTVIPPEWSAALGESLGGHNVIDPGKGHFAGLHGCTELPSVLEIILD